MNLAGIEHPNNAQALIAAATDTDLTLLPMDHIDGDGVAALVHWEDDGS